MGYKIKGNIVDALTREIFPAELSISGKKIQSIRRINESINRYILPGLIDSHIHIESTMLTPSEFSKIAVRFGTTAVIADPHEIANVAGIEGVDFMIENGRTVPLKFFFGAPSCVPATGFETSGAVIDSDKMKSLLQKDCIYFLSEVMNFPGVIQGDPDILKKISYAKQFRKPIDGHAPGLLGDSLKKYISAGITTDHECLDLEEAKEKISAGMKIQIREGSAAKGFDKFIKLIELYPDSVMLCSDDIHPDELVDGHINKLLARGIEKGVDIFKLIRAASINPVNHYNLPVGILREGDIADLVVVNNISEFKVIETYINGKKVYGGENIHFGSNAANFPGRIKISSIDPKDLRIKVSPGKIRVIKAVDGELFTGSKIAVPTISNGNVVADISRDILKIVIVNKYFDKKPVIAFISGFGLKKGAIAGSIAHDSHNIIAVGIDDNEIASAINNVIEMQGGLSLVSSEKHSRLQLEIAGLMTDRDGYRVAEEYRDIDKQAKSLGSQLKAPFMTLSFMALLVIPELKISDRGLFDVNRFAYTDLFVE